MIVSFGDQGTEDVFFCRDTKAARKFLGVFSVAKRKLDLIHAANTLNDLRQPPNNKLEALKDDLKGYHGIRISGKWRVIFRWINQAAHDVRIVDYH